MARGEDRVEKLTADLIREIMEQVRDLDDRDYIACLEEIAGVCDDAAIAKREGLNGE